MSNIRNTEAAIDLLTVSGTIKAIESAMLTAFDAVGDASAQLPDGELRASLAAISDELEAMSKKPAAHNRSVRAAARSLLK